MKEMIETERLLLREYTMDDLDALYEEGGYRVSEIRKAGRAVIRE